MAEQQQNASVPTYMGEFCHAVDGKNRITLPAKWRTSEGDELFLMPGTAAHCLRILPKNALDEIRAKAAALSGAERTVALRRIGSQSRQVSIDKHGRLSLPDEFCQQLKLSGEVTLVGVVETFEIWNSDEWKAAQAAQVAAADATLAALGL